MAVVAMKQLLEAGVHFGHQTRRWDPKMAEYIFQARNGIHIIDLQKTSKKLDEAYAFVKEQVEEGKTVLFVGTKKQAQECMKEAAIKCGMYYVDQRWLGGMLTNFGTIQKRIQRLKDLETMEQDGTFDLLPKKEVILLKKEMEKLERNLGGIKDMDKLPGVIFLVDPKKERIAILEARKLNIPVVGLVDTNCNPEDVDYAIPGNDDAIRAVKLIADVMANAVIEGNQGESFDAEDAKGVKLSTSPLLNDDVKPYYRDYVCNKSHNGYQSLHITFYDNSSRSYMELQLRTKRMDDIAEIGPANHLEYEKRQEKERIQRDTIPKGECIYFDEAYERGMKLLNLDLTKIDVNMFTAMSKSLINDGCGLYHGRLILPYEHLSRFQNDLID